MQNIALIVNSLQGGGAERCAADLSLIFAKRGFQVYIFTDLTIKIDYEYAGTLVNYSSVSLGTNDAQKENPLRHKVKELEELKKKYSIEIAISFMQNANYFNILSRGKEKTILTTHSINSEYAKYEKTVFWSEETFRNLYQYADFITFPSDFCREDWLRHYGDENNITRTIYNPVHIMPVHSSDNKKNTVITVGRMQGVKRQWHLIKAFKLVKKMCPDSKLIILGDGELRTQLKAMIAQYDLTNDVEMPGNVKNVQDYLAQAKVFVMTSRCEAMPCSVLEALSAGVPVVSCDTPGGIREELGIPREQKDLVAPLRGACGIITPYIKENSKNDISWEEEILAKEIVRLLKDEEMRTEMAREAVKMSQRFSADIIGSIWVDDILKGDLNREIDQSEYERIKEKNLSDDQSLLVGNVQMYISYYRLLEKWMILRERGSSAKQYFVTQGVKNIIIYGLGKMANHLIEDIKGSDINIVCGIDLRAVDKYRDFAVITLENTIPEADCIIITPVHETESIKQKLEERTIIPIVSLSEIIDKCM